MSIMDSLTPKEREFFRDIEDFKKKGYHAEFNNNRKKYYFKTKKEYDSFMKKHPKIEKMFKEADSLDIFE